MTTSKRKTTKDDIIDAQRKHINDLRSIIILLEKQLERALRHKQ